MGIIVKTSTKTPWHLEREKADWLENLGPQKCQWWKHCVFLLPHISSMEQGKLATLEHPGCGGGAGGNDIYTDAVSFRQRNKEQPGKSEVRKLRANNCCFRQTSQINSDPISPVQRLREEPILAPHEAAVKALGDFKESQAETSTFTPLAVSRPHPGLAGTTGEPEFLTCPAIRRSPLVRCQWKVRKLGFYTFTWHSWGGTPPFAKKAS